ncbi:hypothetical protein TCAL_01950 [Tigriopus californicus]|uniref:Bardet-Biedl syndrome 7 protein homolog n=1 Tax=Tigriopus californicus TaxID=6832 RepID=A0A553P6A0_TIGCA|nr:hypothetical protein TCAL_01950 [Tigriopus californicus]
MDLNLARVDYMQVGLTSPRTMRLMPSPGGKSQQRVAVADHAGILQVFSMKRQDVTLAFKTLPGPEIRRLELGGALGTVKDKIFISAGNEIRGFTKKGKQFLSFETNLTETIQTASITGNDLLVAGQHVYNHYQDCQDMNYFLSEDKINDILALPGEKVSTLSPLLACQDRSIKMLRDSNVLYSAELPGPPTCLQLYYNDGGENGDEVLYGTSDGKLGLMKFDRKGPQTHWLIEREGAYGAILSMDNYDITGDGVRDLIVGRHDGNIEVYTYDDDINEDSEPTLKYTHVRTILERIGMRVHNENMIHNYRISLLQNCGESVNSIEGGVVGNAGYEEIVVTTYSGWCFGMTSESVEAHTGLQVEMASITDSTRERLGKLRSEIETLQLQVNYERDRYQSNATLDNPPSSISAIPKLDINDRFTLSQADASYNLSLEVQTSIDNVLLQSDVPVDLLDVEKNSAVVSYSACDPQSGNALLATYRCQANTTRLEIKIRTIEGQYGVLQVYITPRLQPKCCQVQQYQIKPLSLHMRTHKFDKNRPANVLHLKGQFTLAEMHNWVGFCLPEVPEKPPSGDVATFTFISTFLDTLLQISYSKGEATFKSDNISTISILKDFLTREATKKRINLMIDCDVNDESVTHTLRLLHPKLESQLLLAKQVAMIQPLKDLAAHEENLDFLSPEFQYILDNAEELENQFKRQPAQLERLYGMITDLFIDQHKFKGQNVKSKVGQLLDILDKYNLEALIEFFKTH